MGVPSANGSLSRFTTIAARALQHIQAGGMTMLFTLALILLIAWALGLGGVYAIGSIVHVLLVIAIVLFLVGLISGRETVA